jgi:Zn-dependent peptidase ImmA (M78 family)
MPFADPAEWRAIVRRVLAQQARTLALGRALPIELDALLGDLGISVVLEPARAVGLLRYSEGRWQIVVDQAMQPVRRRFTVAHELGHYLVESRLDFRPTTSREYWMLEDECQTFAAALLAPPAAVGRAIGDGAGEPSGLIDAVARLASLAGIAVEGAARRIVEYVETPTVLALIDLGESTGTPGSASVVWLHGSKGTLSAGRGRRIRTHDALATVVVRARATTPGSRSSVEMESGPAVVLRHRDSTALVAATPRRSAQASGVA